MGLDPFVRFGCGDLKTHRVLRRAGRWLLSRQRLVEAASFVRQAWEEEQDEVVVDDAQAASADASSARAKALLRYRGA